MTNQTPESVIAEVLDEERYYDRSQISNDSRATEIVEALRAANMLREPGVPDAPRRAVRELIAEARGFWGSETSEYAEGLVGRLADALEAATRVPVHGEPNDDRTPEFEAIEQELFNHQPLLSMQDGSIRGCKCMDRVFVTKTEDWGTHLAEVFMRLPRATVPDAATEELQADRDSLEERNTQLGNQLAAVLDERDAATAELTEAIRLTVEYTGNDLLPAIEGWSWFDALKKYAHGVAQAFVDKPIRFPKIGEPDAATEGDYHEGLEEGIKIGRAERDAALAAVEVTRKLHHKITRYGNDHYSISAESYEDDPSSYDDLEPFDLCAECYEVERLICEECGGDAPIGHRSSWPCPTVAALDGAPEPEWEYGYRGMYAVMHPTKAGQRIETPEITQRTPDNWLPEMGEIYRRRPSAPAGPWEACNE